MTAAQEITTGARPALPAPLPRPSDRPHPAPARYSRRSVLRVAVTLFGWPLVCVTRSHGEREGVR